MKDDELDYIFVDCPGLLDAYFVLHKDGSMCLYPENATEEAAAEDPHWKFIETLNWKPERTSLCFVTHIKKGPCTLMVGLRLKKQNKRDKRVSLRCCCVAVSPQRAAVVVFNQTLQVWPRGSALVQLVW